jgi:choline dehydrogenase-like flavoprotein
VPEKAFTGEPFFQMDNHYDFIVIGTGAGGGTLAQHLAGSGKRVLILERGEFLPREKENWNTTSVFLENRYHTKETWKDKSGKDLHPGTGYWVGGNTKVYGAALFRLRTTDFEELQHVGGISPEWPVKYDEFEPYYCKAEKIYCVHGKGGIDPTEPPMSQEYPYEPVSHEPRIQELFDEIGSKGYKPFPVPVGIKLNEKHPEESQCIRCDSCDGYPCLVHAKSDADVNCVRPVYQQPNVTLVTGAYVERLIPNAAGNEIKEVEVILGGKTEKFIGDVVIVSCGAINSAALLLRSACSSHPNGLANGSDQVGRNFMFHQAGAILSIGFEPNHSKFMKTFSVNDFYYGDKDFKFPMGNVQLIGSFHHEMMKGDAPKFTPGIVLEEMATHAVPWWLTAEDLPSPDNRVKWVPGKGIELDYTINNEEAYTRLMNRWTGVLREISSVKEIIPTETYFKKRIPLEGVGHQNGTCRFGHDPKTSVLDRNCRSHEIDNLYVVDGAFFPSSAAVNPSLTIMANALRVGDHLLERFK